MRMFSGSSCTRRAEVEGLAQGQGLAAQGGAETLAPGLRDTSLIYDSVTTIFKGHAPDQDLGPGPSRVTVPGPDLGLGGIQ